MTRRNVTLADYGRSKTRVTDHAYSRNSPASFNHNIYEGYAPCASLRHCRHLSGHFR